MSAPFFAVDSERWPRMLAKLRTLGPLDDDDARTDLRYLENEHRVWRMTDGRRGAAFPGRRALESRWEWPERRVRAILAADDWHDPTNPVAREDLCVKRPSVPVAAPQTSPCASPSVSPSPNQPTPTIDEICPAAVPVAAPQTSPSMSIARASSEPRSTTEPLNHILRPANADAPTPKPTRPRKPKADSKPPPHPYHQRVIDAWDRVHTEATRQHYGGGDRCVLTGHEIRLLTGIRDGHLPRVEGPDADAAMQRVGAAFRRYHAEALAGRAFPPGPPTVRGFCHDPAAWFADGGQHRARDAPTARGRPSPLDVHDDALAILRGLAPSEPANDLPPNAIDITCEVAQ